MTVIVEQFVEWRLAEETEVPLCPTQILLNPTGGRSRAAAVGSRKHGMGWTTWVWFPAGSRDFLFSTASRPALRPTQLPIKWAPGPFSLGVKRPGREADHLPPFKVYIKNGGAIPPPPLLLYYICRLNSSQDNKHDHYCRYCPSSSAVLNTTFRELDLL
jgi:hypothetical protein